MSVRSRSCAPGAPPPSALPATRRGHRRVSRDRSPARAREAARGQRWQAGSLPVRARLGRVGEGRGGEGRGGSGGEGRGGARSDAGGQAAGGGTRGGGGGWPAKRVPDRRGREGGDAPASVRRVEEAAALEAPESAAELRAGVGGFLRPPGHGGCGRWLARRRCGPEPCGAGTVAVLTPAGPSRGYEAEPLPRPTAASAAGRPPGGWGTAGG